MTTKRIGAWLARYWYVVLLALATYGAFTGVVFERWFGPWIAWVCLTALVVAALIALLGKRSE